MFLKELLKLQNPFKLKIYRCCSNLAYIHQPGKDALLYKNTGQQVERAVDKYGHCVAIKSWHEQTQLTYEESYNQAVNLVVKLKELGLKQGDHLGIWAPNTIQWFITYLAAAIGGFPLVCINPALQVPELEFALKKAKVKILVTMDSYGKLDFLHKLQQLSSTESYKQSPLTIVIKSDDAHIKNFLNYEVLLDKQSPAHAYDDVKSETRAIPPESPSIMQFTSGTTGQPKLALVSHYNMVNDGVYLGRALKLQKDSKTICVAIPMFHAFCLGLFASALHYGGTLCLPSPTFNSIAALEAIERDRCAVVVGTPTMFIDMIDNQTRMNKSMESLERAIVGGAACSAKLYNKSKEVLQLRELYVGYGLSEGTCAVFIQDGSETLESAVNSVGKIFDFGEAKIIDEEGKTLKFGEVGELCIRGWFNMIGYYEDDENTRKIKDVDGWLRTGDQFLLEPNGIARFQGRKKEMICRGGENVFPKEIENCLEQHESILEAHVISVPDARLGEEICAYLRLKHGVEPLTLNDINAFCKDKLAYFKIPRYVRIVDDFPRTAAGKIQKFKLQELFQEGK